LRSGGRTRCGRRPSAFRPNYAAQNRFRLDEFCLQLHSSWHKDKTFPKSETDFPCCASENQNDESAVQKQINESFHAMAMPQTKIATTRFVTLATYAANRPVAGAVVTVLDSSHEARGLKLISTYSRALPKNSIHELIATDEIGKKPGDTANRIAYLAFFEVTRGGCVIVGETLFVDGKPIGPIIGFDETHEPNHINIIIGVEKRQTGPQLKISVGGKIKFTRK
jgi:hypothetical protein